MNISQWIRQQTEKHRLLTVSIIVALVALIAFALAVLRFGWDWTGFNGGFSQTTTTSTVHGTTMTTVQPPTKSFWDWLQLAIIPVVIAGGGIWLSRVQKSTEQRITTDNQQAAALQAYIDKMSELLLHEKLLDSLIVDEVQSIARARTLAVLTQLNAHRKRGVILFLYESNLIKLGIKNNTIVGGTSNTIDLNGVDLTEANLSDLSLNKVNLSKANLSGANLSKTLLHQAVLKGANLSNADLGDAILFEADLSEVMNMKEMFLSHHRHYSETGRANLSGANLQRAILAQSNLQGANLCDADLHQANLFEADLRGAYLIGADLSSAILDKAIVTQDQLDKAKSLKGATMPDGTKHL